MPIPDEDQQLLQLYKALRAVDEWSELTGTNSGTWTAVDGSELADDDVAAHPYTLTSGAWASLTAAVSHLVCLERSLFEKKAPDSYTATFDTHAQFPLVRAALENASMALWLLAPDQREQRVLRRLQQDWNETRQIDKIRELLGDSLPKTRTERLAELSAIAAKTGADPTKIKHGPDYSDVVLEAGSRIMADGKTALVIWKACSALAHGEMRASIYYLSATPVSEPRPGFQLAHVTSHVPLLVTGTLAAVKTTETAFALYRKRATV